MSEKDLLLQLALQIPATIIALIAIVYSIKSYYLNNRINNENILYQEKITGYKEVMYALNDLLNVLQVNFYTTKFILSRKVTEEDEDLLDELANEIDEKAAEFDNVVISNSAILSEVSLKKLEYFLELLYQNKSLEELKKIELNRFELLIDELLENAASLNVYIRKELNTENLDLMLFKRIQNVRGRKK